MMTLFVIPNRGPALPGGGVAADDSRSAPGEG